MGEEVNTAVAEAQAPAGKKPAGKKHRSGHPLRNGLIALGVAAALGVGGVFLFNFLNDTKEVDSQIMTSTADFGTIQSKVQGSGSARSKETAAITLQNAGTVQKLYVTEGQVVMEGEPLYEVVSPAAQEALDVALDGLSTKRIALTAAQTALTVAQESYDRVLTAQRQSNEDRFIRAPFSGQLRLSDGAKKLVAGDKVENYGKIATLVDDLKFRLPLYFSYAYEGQISAGQTALVTVGSTDLSGKVEEVNMVRRVTPEGTVLFEVVVIVPNPGAFTEGLSGTAQLTAPDGLPIYPYSSGKLEYYRTHDIYIEAPKSSTTAEDPQTVLSTILRDYLDVKAGELLLSLSPENFDKDLRQAEEVVRNSQDNLKSARDLVERGEEDVEKARKALADFSAVAPISGTVTSCTLVEGQEVKSGDTVITIANNTTMVVTIQVDDRNIAYVKPGMMVDLQSNWGSAGSFVGTVTKIDMSLSGDAMGSGMTNYPVTLEVDNYDGSLLEGMWLSYSFVTSQSDNCIVVPMQSVKYVSTEDGGTASVVFIQAGERPENAVDIDIPETMPGQAPAYPSQKDGYWPVAVETGLSDSYNVEITSGLQGGEEVFVSYIITQAWS